MKAELTALQLKMFWSLILFPAPEASPRLAELRRRRLGPGLPPAGSIRRSNQERASDGRGLPLPQRLHSNGNSQMLENH